MIQTQWVVTQLRRLWPNLDITIEQIRTTGDRITNVPLAQIGGDGVFVTEIEYALQERRVDVAVHSLKDLPTQQPEGLCLIIAGPREDVRDVFVSNMPFSINEDGLQPLNHDNDFTSSLRVGTCSLRRTAQILRLCPQTHILPLRGNVDTRLRKLEAGEYDGIILAAAGLHRMELGERLVGRLSYFPLEAMLPAPGQGALAIEIRDEVVMHDLLASLNDRVVQAATSAERMFMRSLGAGCYLPVAAHAEVVDGALQMVGRVVSLDGQRQIRVGQNIPWTSETGNEQAELLGKRLADRALAEGAADIIQGIERSTRKTEQEE